MSHGGCEDQKTSCLYSRQRETSVVCAGWACTAPCCYLSGKYPHTWVPACGEGTRECLLSKAALFQCPSLLCQHTVTRLSVRRPPKCRHGATVSTTSAWSIRSLQMSLSSFWLGCCCKPIPKDPNIGGSPTTSQHDQCASMFPARLALG